MSDQTNDARAKFMHEAPSENVMAMDSRYECPICLNYLEDAVLTSCGHRFCLRCINLWLEQKGSSCPVDVRPLSHKDIFPDNFTRREITQARINSTSKVGVEPSSVSSVHQGSGGHSDAGNNEKKGLPSSYGTSPNPHDPLITAMYERIILLEQRAHEQDILVENLRRKVAEMQVLKSGVPWASRDEEEEVALRCCHGLFVWRIRGFTAQLQLMRKEVSPPHATPQMLYSPRFYTRPYCGYRFCVRLNVSPRNSEHLSLVVHVVRGEFDDILHWPFSGHITLELVNQRDFPRGDSLREVVGVGGEGAPRAFSRPPQEGERVTINPRGFGYMEFVALSDLEPGGFLFKDTLTIKVRVEEGDK